MVGELKGLTTQGLTRARRHIGKLRYLDVAR